MNNTCRNAPSPVLKNTCRGPRASMLQCAGCLPPHTDRIQQDIRPTDRPSAAGAEDGARRRSATSRRTTTRRPTSTSRRRRRAGQLRQPERRPRLAAPEGRPRRRPFRRRTPLAEPRPHSDGDGLRGNPGDLSAENGPSTVAPQQRCHRASEPAQSPSWPPMPPFRLQRPPPSRQRRIRSPLRNRIFSVCTADVGSRRRF